MSKENTPAMQENWHVEVNYWLKNPLSPQEKEWQETRLIQADTWLNQLAEYHGGKFVIGDYFTYDEGTNWPTTQLREVKFAFEDNISVGAFLIDVFQKVGPLMVEAGIASQIGSVQAYYLYNQ